MSAFVFRCTILYLTISTPPVFVCFWLFHSFVRGERKDPSKVPVSARLNYRLPPSNLPGEEGAGRKAISLKHLLFARRGKKILCTNNQTTCFMISIERVIHKKMLCVKPGSSEATNLLPSNKPLLPTTWKLPLFKLVTNFIRLGHKYPLLSLKTI